MYENIQVRNFRCITRLDVDDLAQVNLFVGQNNCGKTTLLEAFFLLIGATNPELPAKVNIFRGLPFVSNDLWASYFYNLDSTIPIEIIGQMSQSHNKQHLSIHPRQKKAIVIPNSGTDTLSFAGDSKRGLELDGLELHYKDSDSLDTETVCKLSLKGKELVFEGYKEPPVRGIFVSPTTEFDWRIRFDSIQQHKRTKKLISAIQLIEPRLSDLRLNASGVLVGDIGLASLIPFTLFGGGTARFLSIAMSMLDSPKGIVLIDEIESGLHYSVQQTVWEAVFAWANEFDVQVIATTHSYECIKAYKKCVTDSLFPDQAKLFRIERKNELFSVVTYLPDELDRFLRKMWEVR